MDHSINHRSIKKLFPKASEYDHRREKATTGLKKDRASRRVDRRSEVIT